MCVRTSVQKSSTSLVSYKSCNPVTVACMFIGVNGIML